MFVCFALDSARPGPLPAAGILLFFGLTIICYGWDAIVDLDGSFYARTAAAAGHQPSRSEARAVAWFSMAIGAAFALPGMALSFMGTAGM